MIKYSNLPCEQTFLNSLCDWTVNIILLEWTFQTLFVSECSTIRCGSKLIPQSTLGVYSFLIFLWTNISQSSVWVNSTQSSLWANSKQFFCVRIYYLFLFEQTFHITHCEWTFQSPLCEWIFLNSLWVWTYQTLFVREYSTFFCASDLMSQFSLWLSLPLTIHDVSEYTQFSVWRKLQNPLCEWTHSTIYLVNEYYIILYVS